MKRILIVFFSLILIPWARSQDYRFHGTVRNSIYCFESDKVHTRYYQYAHLNLTHPRDVFSLSMSARALTDANQTLTHDQRFKAYTLNASLKNLCNHRFSLTLGRQFLYPGTVLGSLDGLNGQFKMNNSLSIQLYGGMESAFDKSLNINKPQRLVFGSLVDFKSAYSTKVQWLYLQKNDKGQLLWQVTGVNIYSTWIPRNVITLQTHLDLHNQTLHRVYIATRYSASDRCSLNFSFKSASPQIYANSFFTIMELEGYNQLRAGGSYELWHGYRVGGEFQFLAVAESGAEKLYLNFSSDNGSLGLIFENGYSGDQTGIMFDYAYEIIPNLVASVYADYSKYRVDETFEYDNQLGNAMRLGYRLNKNISVDVEYQWLSNQSKKQDSRFLNHLLWRW
jgi:hypothetical protein